MVDVPQFDPGMQAGPAYVYARVADDIEAKIKAGQLVPGAGLLGERDLAVEYQVGTRHDAAGNRGTAVARAGQSRRPPKGTFVVAAA